MKLMKEGFIKFKILCSIQKGFESHFLPYGVED